jgi:preprotein translocase subunit YajC
MTPHVASFAFLQAAPTGGALFQLLPMLLIFVVFWFLLIAPARKRQKQHQALLEALKRGDAVVTSGGIYGEVAAIEGTTVWLKIADNVKIRVSRGAIAGLEGEAQAQGGK